jgi:hypothetical protein
MARRGHGCRCCCSFHNIFRCEQLSVNLWNQTGELPVLTCDIEPAPGNLVAVSNWLSSGAFARGGSLAIDLDAAGLNLAASSTGSGSIQASLFQGTAIASSEISGSVRSISMNSDQRRAVLDQSHAIAVRSCKVQAGRFVTAYASATPRIADIPAITPRMAVRFKQQGEPGFTKQSIDGLWNPNSGNPYHMTQACRAAVYRDGEYVSTVTRDPSLCKFQPGDALTVSESSGSYPNVQEELDDLWEELGSIQVPPDPHATQRAQLFAQLQQLGAQISAVPPERTFWPGLIGETSVVSGQPPVQRTRTLLETVTAFSFDDLAQMQPALLGFNNKGEAIYRTGAQLAQSVAFDLYLQGKVPERFDLSECVTGGSVSITCLTSVLGGPGGVRAVLIEILQAEKAARDSTLAALIADRDAIKAQYDALPPVPTYTQAQLNRIQEIQIEIARLQKSLGISKVRDWTVQHSGIVRLSGYKARAGFPASGDATGGINIAYLHEDHAYWNGGLSLNTDDSWQDRRIANAVYFYAQAGQRIRLAILYGGNGTLAMEPSGAILGTFDEETSQEGSYLVVTKYDDDCMPSGWQGQRNFDNVDDGWQGLGGYRSYQATLGLTITEPRRLSQRRYEFNSFVVDKTPPSMAAKQIDDFVVDDEPDGFDFSAADRVQASPLIVADEPVVGSTGWATYTTRPAGSGMSVGYYRATNTLLKDRAHNFPALPPVVDFTVHAEMSGARAAFSASGESETIRTSPLTTLDLVFDKPVSGVVKNRFTIEACGKREDGTFGEIDTADVIESVEQQDPTTFRLTLKAGKQLPGTQWRIVFQPNANVIADTGEDTEPCILAARFAWILPQENVRQLIDTTTRLTTVNQRTVDETVTIGDLASVSAAVAEPDPEQPPAITLASSSTVSLPASGGIFHANHDADSFSPNAPSDADAATSVPYSYFGMSTTIYPSPARLLSACAAPLEPQKHFSAMMAANNYTTITAQMATHVRVNGKTYAAALFVPDTTGRPHASFSTNYEDAEYFASNGWFTGDTEADAVVLNRWFFGPFSLSHVSDGLSLSQNQWAAAASSEQAALPIWDKGRVFGNWTLANSNGTLYASSSATLAAARVAQEYPGLNTASAGDLTLTLKITASTRAEATRLVLVDGKPEEVVFPNFRTAQHNREIVFHLSKSQEVALATGSSVQIVVPDVSRKRSPVTDPNSPLPGRIEDINRHVWTLQAS